MSMTGLEAFDSTIQKTHLWIKDTMDQLGTNDKHRAYLALRGVLQTLRDHLTIDEAVELGAQLPALLRGFYYEGYKPAHKPVKERSQQSFLDSVASSFRNEPTVDSKAVCTAVFNVLESRITSGEVADIRHMLPPEIRQLWPQPVGAQA